jgi:hypothetical protein
LVAPSPGTRSCTKAIVAAQMLAQIGAFAFGVAFGHLALITLTGLFFLRRLGARSALQTLAATPG